MRTVLPGSPQKISSAVLICATAIAWAPCANASAEFRLDSSGFLRESSDRAGSSSTLTIRPDFSAANSYVTGNLDLQFSTFLSDPRSYGWEVRDTYLGTSKELSSRHQISLGRRHFDWLKLDEQWQVGLVAPRFQWDPLQPEALGLTGLFYTYEQKAWRVLGFVSPLAIPEHGFPIEVRDHQLYSASPLWNPPMAHMPVMNRNLPIHYDIEYPPAQDLVMNAGAALSVRYDAKNGPSGSITAASLPVNQPDFVLVTRVPAQGQVIDSTLKPRILRHEILTAELGYAEPETAIWSSATIESPHGRENVGTEVSRGIGRTYLVAAGIELYRSSRFRPSFQYLAIHEDKVDEVEAVLLPTRFNYSHATRLALDWLPTPRLLGSARWTRDLDLSSDLLSLDLCFRPAVRSFDQKELGWVFGLGLDLISTPNGEGFIGQFQGDDRIRGRISYVF